MPSARTASYGRFSGVVIRILIVLTAMMATTYCLNPSARAAPRSKMRFGLHAVGVTSSSVTLRWKPPRSSDTFRVQYSTQASMEHASYKRFRGPRGRLTGLSPNSRYYFRVRAISDRSSRNLGAYGPSVYSVQTTSAPTTSASMYRAAVKGDEPGSPISSSDLQLLNWVGVEQPRPGSITTLDPSTLVGGGAAQNGPVMRVELRGGEFYRDASGYTAPRAEVFGRIARSWSDPWTGWPDPAGSERWYDFSIFIPKDFPVATDARWLVFTQWKGLRGGSPPIALEVKRSGLRLGGARTNQGLIPRDGYLGSLAFGQWTRLTVGIHFSTSSADGWVQVYRNGAEVLPRTPVATMDVINSQPDPTYLRQGIYRDDVWTKTQVILFSPMTVTVSRPARIS